MLRKLRVKRFGLGGRIVSAMLVAVLTIVIVNYAIFIKGFRQRAQAQLVEKAAVFTAIADATKKHVSKLNESNVIDLEALLANIDKSKHYSESRAFPAIPVVAGWMAASEAAKQEGIEFHIAAFDARNKLHEPQIGSFEHDLLSDLSQQVASGGAQSIYRTNKNTNQLHYMRAIRLGKNCQMCHGEPGNEWDDDNDGIDLLGIPMESWEVGRMHGAYHVVQPLDLIDTQAAAIFANGVTWTIPLVIVAVLLFALFLRFLLMKPINTLIHRVKESARGEGDLTHRLAMTRNDEIGELARWFDQFIAKIHDIIVAVRTSTEEVALGSSQIAAASDEMSRGMKEQSDEIMQISTAVEEMSASIVSVAQRSSVAANRASESGKVAENGGKIVDQTIDVMNTINESVTSSAGAVRELGVRGQEIGHIIDVINDIADQTNLLALNAAIEAARAGKHGLGFAVVADEVRKLADRTTNATAQVAESITMIQTETSEAVVRMESGTQQMTTGVEQATRAGKSLQEIVSNAHDVSQMIKSIASAAEAQSAISEQVSKSITSISCIATKAKEGTHQAAEAVSGLAIRTSQLQALVGQFRLQGDEAKDGNKWQRSSTEKYEFLIVDDDPSLLSLLEHYLKDLGQCTTASGGKEAIASVRTMLDLGVQYDAICVDIMMPDINGVKVVTEIRKMEKELNIPHQHRSKIIMVTALSDPRDKLKAFRESCDNYLTKPVNQTQILEVMAKFGITPIPENHSTE